MDKERGENGKVKGENGKVRGTPQSLCDSSPINKGAKRGDEIAAKAAVDGRPRREAMGERYPNIIRDNGQRKRGILDCEVEAIKEYLLGMYAED